MNIKEKNKSTRKTFFWDSKAHLFSKPFSIILFVAGLVLLMSGIVVNYFYKGTLFYITVPLNDMSPGLIKRKV